jgi:uncharacterized protein YbaP (TraB family)
MVGTVFFSRILRSYLACLGVLFCQVIAAALPSSGPAHGLLWEIGSPDSSPSYLFGTIHSEDPGVVGLAPAVEHAFTGSRQVILEVNLDTDAMVAGSTAMLLTDGQRLSEIVGKSLFEQTAAALRRRGIPDMMTEHMKPWAAATALSMPVPETGRVLDVVLFQRAQQAGKPLHGLETITEQLEVFDGLPLEDQVELLRVAVEQVAGLDGILAELLAAYKRQDLAAMMAINEAAMAVGDQRLAGEFQRRLIVDRNHRMVERMVPWLKQGGAFVAVGALHLPGEKGLVSLLRQRGYSVRAVEY